MFRSPPKRKLLCTGLIATGLRILGVWACASNGVEAAETVAAPVSFLNEIMPLLTKAGCNAGACHAKPEGQNNFKLSVFGYDPQLDFNEIVTDGRGRRVFFAAPEESLLLQKATGKVPHEGGSRFGEDSETYKKVLAWLQQGAPFDGPETPHLTGIAVSPKQLVLEPGGSAAIKVTASFSDGSHKDVSALTVYTSNDKELVAVSELGVLKAGNTRGEAVVVANYMGVVDVVRPVIPPAKRLVGGDFKDFPVQTEPDRLVYKRLEALGLLPSALCSDTEFIRRSALDSVGRLPTARLHALLCRPS